MREEQQNLPPDAPADTPETPSQPTRRPRTSSQQRKRRNSVFQYIAILFAAAFVLLLFTFVMERRQHELLQEENQEQINNLQQSVSAVQSLQNLYDENAALSDQVADLEDQVEQLQQDLSALKEQSQADQEALVKTSQAMDWFWQLDEAYVRGRYSLCRQIIQTLEDATAGTALKEYLPTESATDNGRFSPSDRYQEIYDHLF